ncbi:glycine betaine ABC transporter substrate-binding protein [Herbaspirillum huttiense]|uniref:glycine betaine ABC transporter substrate-binding protein n=1 Tax=Herbaspirillum huttiense TaxID=863372 RepID=UPI0039B05B7E
MTTKTIAKYALCALALGLAMFGTARAQAQNLVIGGKNFTEQLLLSDMTAQYLRAKGYDTDLKSGLGTTLMRSALESGQIDIVWDYTGTALIVYNHIEDKLDPDQIYQKVKDLDAPRGLTWLNQSELNNTYAFAMPREVAEKYHIRSLQDLADRINEDDKDGNKQHLLGVDYEFASRPDGLGPMQALYGFKLNRSEVKQMDPGLVYTALKNEQLFVGLTYASDGRIKGFDLQLLEDDKGYFAAYKATPVVRQDILDKNPQLAEQLNALAAKIDTATMTELNKRVDIDQEPVAKVAADFLKQAGLI